MESTFELSEVLRTSWARTKEQIWVLVGLAIGFTILSLILSLLTTPFQSSTAGIIGVNLLSLIISCIFQLGYYKNIFQALDGEEPQFSAYGQQARKIVSFFIASLITSVLVLIGTAFLIIPGIYMAVRLQFFIAFIVEENAGPIDSLKRSWAITQAETMPLFQLFFATIGLILLGCILFLVGIFVMWPLILMMQCYVYRKLNAVKATPQTAL